MLNALQKIFGSKNDRELKKIQPLVEKINALEDNFRALSDEDLKAMTPRLKEKLEKGATLDEILPAAFATVREASRRVMGMRHYDVQLIGGIFLHRGCICEMRTGEGKTLVSTGPAYLNALTGKGVHIITVNDYLASRDAEWMGRIHRFLGLTVGTILTDMSDEDRKAAYSADVTYGTNNEFGFDYLRDNMKFSLDRKVQRGHNYAIVDEVDSILIDEARTPLIISGRANQSTALYAEVNKIVPFLKRDEDYIVDEEHHSVVLTDEGVETVEHRLKLDNIYAPANIEYLHHVNKALQAHTLYKKDVNYIIDDGQVVIVDEHGGRPMPGRRWSDGLHQAVEAKEGVKIRDENETLATVTFQNFFRMYGKLSGMTGTADTEAEEFKEIYKLETRVIPTNKPVIRLDQDDVIYRTEREKFNAVVNQIVACHEKGQPVLVGTTSVEKSEAISKVLKRKNIAHNILNAKRHREEADIVSQAGRLKAVTIATNMAGRGTDILLGGNAEALARRDAGGAESGPVFEERLEVYKKQCAAEKEEVLKAGGLFVLATERHESRRIDNQLRGRSGRQGDPGESRFFLSLEDDLLRIFNADRISMIMERLEMPEGEPIESRMVTKALESAQKRVEGRNFDIRKNLLEYDDVMNQQRKTIYALRDKVLEGGEPLYDLCLDAFDRTAVGLLDQYCSEKVRPTEWDVKTLTNEVKRVFELELDFSSYRGREDVETRLWKAIEGQVGGKIESLDYIAERKNTSYAEVDGYEPVTGRTIFLELIQNTFVRAIDRLWRDHLKAMDALRDAIRFQGYAQKDPKKVYKIEGYEQFERMMVEIDQNVVEYMTRIQVERDDQVGDLAPDAVRIRAASQPPVQSSGPSLAVGAQPIARPVIPKGPAAAPAPILGGPAALTDFRSNPQVGAQAPEAEAADVAGAEAEGAGGAEAPKPIVITVNPNLPKVKRNDPCPCGSGERYKKCHMGKEDELAKLLGLSDEPAAEAAPAAEATPAAEAAPAEEAPVVPPAEESTPPEATA